MTLNDLPQLTELLPDDSVLLLDVVGTEETMASVLSDIINAEGNEELNLRVVPGSYSDDTVKVAVCRVQARRLADFIHVTVEE